MLLTPLAFQLDKSDAGLRVFCRRVRPLLEILPPEMRSNQFTELRSIPHILLPGTDSIWRVKHQRCIDDRRVTDLERLQVRVDSVSDEDRPRVRKKFAHAMSDVSDSGCGVLNVLGSDARYVGQMVGHRPAERREDKSLVNDSLGVEVHDADLSKNMLAAAKNLRTPLGDKARKGW